VRLLSVIQDLLAWRGVHGLSQSQAIAQLERAGVPVTLDSLQNWEIGRRKPNGETALALHAFLLQQVAPQSPKGSP
jgi:DNA-binding transcriptional regulator YiaG